MQCIYWKPVKGVNSTSTTSQLYRCTILNLTLDSVLRVGSLSKMQLVQTDHQPAGLYYCISVKSTHPNHKVSTNVWDLTWLANLGQDIEQCPNQRVLTGRLSKKHLVNRPAGLYYCIDISVKSNQTQRESVHSGSLSKMHHVNRPVASWSVASFGFFAYTTQL